MTTNLLDQLPQNEWDALIYSIISRYIKFYSNSDSCITEQDLRQEAWIGLLTACKRYNPDLGVKFSTFAYHYIHGQVARYINKINQKKLRLKRQDLSAVDLYKEQYDVVSDVFDTVILKISKEKDFCLFVEHIYNNKTLRQIASEFGMSHQAVYLKIQKLLQLLEKRMSHENT